MDFIELAKEKKFIGQEFLTWLWLTSEINSSLINLGNGQVAQVWFEERLVLDSGSGDLLESLSLTGRNMGLAEARTGLRAGKKVALARLRLVREDHETILTMKAETLEISGLKLPKGIDPIDDEGGPATLLERVSLLEECIEVLDQLFARFLEIRLSHEWVDTELPTFKKWLKRK